MRVILTGASGFIGRYVLNALQEYGIEAIVIGRVRPPRAENFISMDLLSAPNLTELMRELQPTHLLHLAWYVEHGRYWQSMLNLRWVEATMRLVEAFCSSGGRHVVVAGTCAEYSWEHGYCREESTPLEATTLYGTAKDSTRRLIMATCAEHEASCSWARIFIPFGTGDSEGRLIPSLVSVFKGRRPPIGVAATAYRDFLHASDVAKGFLALLIEEKAGAFNISSGEPTRLAEAVITIARLLDADPTPVLSLSADIVAKPQLLVGENLKLKALGWSPALNFSQGLELMLREDT